MKISKALAASTVVAWTLILLAGPSKAERHPTLVKVDSAQCLTCHEDLLADKPQVHDPVASDCTMCHEFTKAESGTTVDLVDGEPALCLMCHDDLSDAAELALEAPHMPVESCLNCHDPHGSALEDLKLATTIDLCGNCHDLDDLGEPHGNQLTTGTDCTACHVPHGSDNSAMLLSSQQHAPFVDGSCDGCHRPPLGARIRLRARGQSLCQACHGDITESEVAEGGVIHPALEDQGARAGCLNCHDPHMSGFGSLLRGNGPDLCETCHPSVVEAASEPTGHAAAEDCTTCHVPHAATEQKLLTVAENELCGECHDAEDPDLSLAHLNADMARLSCLQCHSPHGAGHPNLLHGNLHPPLEDGCDLCHEGSFSELVDDGESSLCLMCHDDIGDLADQAQVPHPAMELGPCIQCHNPHASAQRKLRKLPDGRECADCHDEQVAGQDEVSHGVISLVGCEACHEPHGGSQEKLLRNAGPELCLSCHGPGVVAVPEDAVTAQLLNRFEISADSARGITILRLSDDLQQDHPIAGHRTLGTPTPEEIGKTESTFSGEFSCLTCHNPHKGKSAKLFNWGAASSMEVCSQCHKK